MMIGITELAEKAGISPITIMRIEKNYPCRLGTKRKLLIAMGIDLKKHWEVFRDNETSRR